MSENDDDDEGDEEATEEGATFNGESAMIINKLFIIIIMKCNAMMDVTDSRQVYDEF